MRTTASTYPYAANHYIFYLSCLRYSDGESFGGADAFGYSLDEMGEGLGGVEFDEAAHAGGFETRGFGGDGVDDGAGVGEGGGGEAGLLEVGGFGVGGFGIGAGARCHGGALGMLLFGFWGGGFVGGVAIRFDRLCVLLIFWVGVGRVLFFFVEGGLAVFFGDWCCGVGFWFGTREGAGYDVCEPVA